MSYLEAAEELKDNSEQRSAYVSRGHCVALAGPGSGKTKTLTLKVARLLAEEIDERRGVACITYNNECVREIENRFEDLGIESGRRLFTGTVHSFSLTQIVLPYAKNACLCLPEDFGVALSEERDEAWRRTLAKRGVGPQSADAWRARVDDYRRGVFDDEPDGALPQGGTVERLVHAYEQELRAMGLIDFDDMPRLALRALRETGWVRSAVCAKYPAIVVDEYQDLGAAVHWIVTELCFGANARLFAVGDADQSVYGFRGADPDLLEQLSVREDVETVRLRLNYRSGWRIVEASSYALGKERNYEAVESERGWIYLHPRRGNHWEHAESLFARDLPKMRQRNPELKYRDIAVLYSAAWIGDEIANAAKRHGVTTIRADKNAPYSRWNRLMRWLEDCAVWCCGGWVRSSPRFGSLVNRGRGLFAEVLGNREAWEGFRAELMRTLFELRDESMPLQVWLGSVRERIVDKLASGCRSMRDEVEELNGFQYGSTGSGEANSLVLGQFAGQSDGSDVLNLSTFHRAKGREFSVTIMFGVDDRGAFGTQRTPAKIAEARRLFYVGFTRAKSEVHIVYSANNPSPLVVELKRRLEGGGSVESSGGREQAGGTPNCAGP